MDVLSRALHDDLHSSLAGALIAQLLPVVLTLMLLAAVVAQTVYLMRQGSFVAAVGAGHEWETRVMVAGAVLLCTCFFAGSSLLYRGVFLVLVITRLLQLSRELPDRRTRLLLRTTCVLIPVVCWVMLLQTMTNLFTSSGSPIRGLHWLLNELAWWWIIGTLSGVVGAFFAQAAAVREFSDLAVRALRSARIARST